MTAPTLSGFVYGSFMALSWLIWYLYRWLFLQQSWSNRKCVLPSRSLTLQHNHFHWTIKLWEGGRNSVWGNRLIQQHPVRSHEAPFSKGTRDVDLGAKVQFSPRPWVSLLRGLPLLRGSAGFKGKAAAFQLDFFGSWGGKLFKDDLGTFGASKLKGLRYS